jgi:DNA mismatch endonuclease, patch repair protein
MVDRLTPEHRSWNMSRIRGKDTAPELALRSMLHRAGYRFRVHREDLPGKPDIYLGGYRTAVFVHGCYWHRHPRCKKATTPGTRTEYWLNKFAGTVRRDQRKQAELEAQGIKVLTVWECELEADPEAVLEQVRSQLRRVH